MNHAEFVAENFGYNDKIRFKKMYQNINDFKTNNNLRIERKYQRINSHEQKTNVENH